MTGHRNPGLHRVREDQDRRVGRDRLEILTTLIDSPSFDPLFRTDIIDIPAGHDVYRWRCVVSGCEWTTPGGSDVCKHHAAAWRIARSTGMSRAEFLASAEPVGRGARLREVLCRICVHRPADNTGLELCRHHARWWYLHNRAVGGAADFPRWVGEQTPLATYGSCLVTVCPQLSDSPLGLCARHERHYKTVGRPGGASLPTRWFAGWENVAVPVGYTNEDRFRHWCTEAPALPWPGQINLRGLRPLTQAEIKWGLFRHTQQTHPTRWELWAIRSVVDACRAQDAGSIAAFDPAAGTCVAGMTSVANEILHELRLVYFTKDESRDAGFIETDHFGVKFSQRRGHFDLTAIPQRWLRDLVWDHLAARLQSPKHPRSGGTIDGFRRAATELGVFLELDAPGGGHDPSLLTAEAAQRFVADQRRRARDGLASLAVKGPGGGPSTVSEVTQGIVFNNARRLLRDALDDGTAQRLGLSREFVVEIPTAGQTFGRTPRRPFPDEVARALADEDNLRRFAEHDPGDRGARDIWETIVTTGRRVGEVLNLPLDCLGRYGGLPMLWHDQTKVGNYDVAIRIPERLYQRLAERQRITVDRFAARHGRPPTGPERARLALFPTSVRSRDGSTPMSYAWFNQRFRAWLDCLDIGAWVPHQARHSIATSLLRAGATLSHIRAYLGHVSDRMAEHYVHLSHSDLEDVLSKIWVAGPGSASPGELLTTEPEAMTSEQAHTLAIDLSRRSTPAEGGFCTFQPVVNGGNCPWNLDCHNCDKFVLSGADLVYWRRKREQWRQLAEGAPDDATADYLHQHFEPTARAIDGLEKALAGLGLLDQALQLDLRKPQDYFHRIWSIGFRAADLADTDTPDQDGADHR